MSRSTDPQPVRMVVRRVDPFLAHLGTDHTLFQRANPREGETCDAYSYGPDDQLMLCRFEDTPEDQPGELFHVDNLTNA